MSLTCCERCFKKVPLRFLIPSILPLTEPYSPEDNLERVAIETFAQRYARNLAVNTTLILNRTTLAKLIGSEGLVGVYEGNDGNEYWIGKDGVTLFQKIGGTPKTIEELLPDYHKSIDRLKELAERVALQHCLIYSQNRYQFSRHYEVALKNQAFSTVWTHGGTHGGNGDIGVKQVQVVLRKDGTLLFFSITR